MRKYLFIICLLSIVFSGCNTTKNKSLRILTCGIRHESNTFSTIRTDLEDFKILRGNELLKEKHLWSDYLKEEGVEIIPTLDAYAWPGGIVTKRAYEKFKSEIINGIKKAGHLDGIYMDMHGALHVDGYDDAQADFIQAIRSVVGDDVVISASFDLHGNISEKFVKGLDILTALRTAPHRDEESTKLRAVKNLIKVINNNINPQIVSVTIPILVPGEKSITEVEPLHSIYASLDTLERSNGLLDASVFVGYAWADLPRSSMQVFVIAEDSMYLKKAENEAVRLSENIWNVRDEMKLDVLHGSIDEMIKIAAKKQKTVFISDSGDNTTAGAPGDNTQVISALLRHNMSNSLVAGLVDEEAYDKCFDAGVGSKIKLTLGGKKDTVFCSPLTLDVTVESKSSDSLINKVVLVKSKGVHIAILKNRCSFTTIKDFSEIGLNPLDFKIVVVKLGYLYPELRDIAPVHLMALTDGFCCLDMCALPFKKIIRPIYPLDSNMKWIPNICN